MHPVLMFWPNIVGYIRLILLVFAFSKGAEDSLIFVSSYLLALGLDGLDGYLARSLNQCSAFGAVLDMLCDRIATCGLVIILTSKYPSLISIGILLIALDFASHYVRMYASMMLHKQSHKEMHGNPSWLLQLYYEKKVVMCLLYAAQELCYLVAYLWAFPNSRNVMDDMPFSRFLMSNLFALFILKQWINILQMINGIQVICDQEQ